jgi:uncharacterized protein (DUF1330 family)
MRAFVIVEISIHDPELYEEYKKLTPASITEYDGNLLYAAEEQLVWRATGSRNV